MSRVPPSRELTKAAMVLRTAVYSGVYFSPPSGTGAQRRLVLQVARFEIRTKEISDRAVLLVGDLGAARAPGDRAPS
jgi:hypothetical protein